MKPAEETKEKIDNTKSEEVKTNYAGTEQDMLPEGEIPNDEGTEQVVGGGMLHLPS